MTTILALTVRQVMASFAANWPFLLAGIVVAAALTRVDARVVRRFLRRRGASSVVLATLVAVATPLCSCGTMAVIIGMLASSTPWAPIVAFMVASPLTSPSELLLSAGLFGWPFALAFFGASVALGLAGGWVAHLLERSGWLVNQARLAPRRDHGRGASPARPGAAAPQGSTPSWRPLLKNAATLVAMFAAFTFVGYFVNNLVPAGLVTSLFGRGQRWGVVLAALLGLPLYVNTEGSLPMVKAFVDGGASQGAALAFLITGAGTSIGAVAGALTIARARVVGLVVGILLVGAIVSGLLFRAVAG